MSRLPGGATPSGGSFPDSLTTNISRCRHSLHRCFVFLGDLARYRELHSQKAKKNFAAAESFYHKALEVIPENGNPHNQLAVLATYVEAETVAVYRYCRSLLIAQPFATAEENLALLFERSRQRPLTAPSSASASLTSSSPSKEKSSFLKSFLHRLTRMHGILFSMATRSGNNSTNGTSHNGSANGFGVAASSRSGALVYPRDMELLLFKDLAVLLRAGVIGDALLLKVVVTNIFCVVRSLSSNSQALDDAVRLSVLTATSVLEFLVADITAKQQHRQRTGSASPEKLAPGMRLLGPVSVFCDFLRYNSEYLDVIAKIYATQKVNDAPDAEVEESSSSFDQFAVKFLESLAALLNHSTVKQFYSPLVSGMTDSNQQLDLLREQQLLLKENIELQGFSPLTSLLDGASKWSNGSSASHSALPEADAVKVRAWNLFHFAKLLCGEGRAGEPLLFVAASGDFVRSRPAVAAVQASTVMPGSSGSSSQSFDSGLPSFSLGLFGLNQPGQDTSRQPQPADVDDDDDFDDEVIVFQPSPGLTAMSRNGPIGGNMRPADKSSLSPAFDSLPGGEPFSLRSPSPPVSENGDGRNSIGGRFGNNSAAPIGSSLGYPSFHSFGDFSGFSGQGLLSGWGSSSDAGSSSSAATTTMGMGSSSLSSTSMFPLDQGSGLFPLIGDLAAVERASAQYQREESSLSSILAPPPSRLSTGSIGGFRTSSLSPDAPRASSRPPPGFSGMTPFGSQETDDANGFEELSARAQPFFTRNPFINP